MGSKKSQQSFQTTDLDIPIAMLHNETDSSETERLLPNNEVRKKKFPFHVIFILGNEFCERYSFYGMRTILVLYLSYYISWDGDTSTAVFHAFNVLCYLFPLFGAILADGWWGKYRTILWLSIVYAIGMFLNTLGAVKTLGDLKTHKILSSIGLVVIAIGTGGIKPCVAAFGGDQFDFDQVKYRAQFFSIFYFAINAGSLISTFVSPMIRENVKCLGTDCYALAFGIPAVLMVLATLLFVGGTRWYRIIPPTGDIFTQVVKVIFTAIKNRWNTEKYARNKDHWLDYAKTSENATLVRDIKYVLNVLVLFIPLPLFWTLFDQQGSRWTLQAVRMNGYIGNIRILPDQMQICNPLLIIILIPISETLLYPCLNKLKIPFRPLQRMTVGMILAGLSFVVAALVHMKIDVHLTPIPQLTSESSLRVINAADCNIVVYSNIYPEWSKKLSYKNAVEGGGLYLKPGEASNTAGTFVYPGKYSVKYACENSSSEEITIVPLQSQNAYDLYISQKSNKTLKHFFTSHIIKKSDDGNAIVTMVNTLNVQIAVDSNITVKSNEARKLTEMEKGKMVNTLNVQIAVDSNITVKSNEARKLTEMEKGNYKFTVDASGYPVKTLNYTVDTGGIYTLVVRSTNDSKYLTIDPFVDVNPSDVSIFWMIPQYFLITLGEIFLSVTGYAFSYSQAPMSMKSVLQSIWLLTVAIGNLVIVIVAEARLIDSQTNEYFLFAGLIGIATIVFMFLAYRYKYVEDTEFDYPAKQLKQEIEEQQ